MYSRCDECNHLECLHTHKGNYKVCTLCECKVRLKETVVFDEDDDPVVK